MTMGGLFEGIGGFSLGMQRAGFDISWQVEIDQWCRQVLKKNFPDAKRYGDIREVGKHNLEPVDIICGGFPCQPFSQAGKRGGASDDRYLWPEMLRVIDELRPTWVIGENVPGILSMELPGGVPHMEGKTVAGFEDYDLLEAVYNRQKEMVVERICQDLEQIGYAVQPLDIPAIGVDAPHLRHRVWFVARREPEASWIECPDCDGFYCTIHRMHTYECECPPIDEWESDPYSTDLGDPNRERQPQSEGTERNIGRRVGDSGADVSDAQGVGVQGLGASWQQEPRTHAGEGLFVRGGERSRSAEWETEPGVGRVADGIPRRVDRIKGLGNAVVPQIPEILGRYIMQIEADQ